MVNKYITGDKSSGLTVCAATYIKATRHLQQVLIDTVDPTDYPSLVTACEETFSNVTVYTVNNRLSQELYT